MNELRDVGSISFWLFPPPKSWEKNQGCRFPDFSHGPILVTAEKRPDQTLHIMIAGPFGLSFEFDPPCPQLHAHQDGRLGLHVGLTWSNGSVVLYLQGQRQESKRLDRH